MKLIHSVLFLAFAASLLAQDPPKPAAPGSPPAPPPDKVVISVGDSRITITQFYDLLEMLPEQNRGAVRSSVAGRKQFADQIVRVLILADEGRRLKIDQTPEYKVQAQFQSQNLLAGKAYGNLAKVDEAELRKYFEAHKADFEQVRARHILIRAAGSPVALDAGKKELSDAEALEKAKQIRQKIVDGADFAQLASQESDDGSKTNGGDLNFFHRGQLVPPFEQAAFSLKVGEISQPVKTPFGYHIIKVEAHKDPNFDDARPEIEKRLQPEKSKGIVDDLVNKAKIVLDPEFFGEASAPTPAPAPPPAK